MIIENRKYVLCELNEEYIKANYVDGVIKKIGG